MMGKQWMRLEALNRRRARFETDAGDLLLTMSRVEWEAQGRPAAIEAQIEPRGQA